MSIQVFIKHSKYSGIKWACRDFCGYVTMLYNSKQPTNRKLDVSEKKGEPDLTSGSEQMKVQNHLK